MIGTTVRWRMLGAAASVASLLILAACGGDGGPGVASAGGEGGTAGPAETAGTRPPDEDAQALAFAGCMRENGVDLPDPAPGQQGLVDAFRSVAGSYDRTTIDAAFDACQDLLPQYSAQQPHGSDEWQLAVAACLREQGLDVSDDLFSDLHSGELDPDQLAAAMEQCRDVVSGGDH